MLLMLDCWGGKEWMLEVIGWFERGLIDNETIDNFIDYLINEGIITCMEVIPT